MDNPICFFLLLIFLSLNGCCVDACFQCVARPFKQSIQTIGDPFYLARFLEPFIPNSSSTFKEISYRRAQFNHNRRPLTRRSKLSSLKSASLLLINHSELTFDHCIFSKMSTTSYSMEDDKDTQMDGPPDESPLENGAKDDASDGDDRERSPSERLKEFMLSSIRWYRQYLSPIMPPNCRFQPSCSVYAIDAITKFGPIRGGVLTAWRILRCSPVGGSGYDPPRWPPVNYFTSR